MVDKKWHSGEIRFHARPATVQHTNRAEEHSSKRLCPSQWFVRLLFLSRATTAVKCLMRTYPQELYIAELLAMVQQAWLRGRCIQNKEGYRHADKKIEVQLDKKICCYALSCGDCCWICAANTLQKSIAFSTS
jgi:hypothetical protein